MKSKRLVIVPTLTIACALLGACAQSDDVEQGAEEFYENNDVTLIVGYPPGGGFDAYAQIIAPHLGEHLPGNPEVKIQYMPGAGSLVAANRLQTLSEDGSTMVHFTGGLILSQIAGASAAEFESTEVGYVGAPVRETSVCVAHRDRLVQLEDLKDGSTAFVTGGLAPGTTSTDNVPNTLIDVLDLNIKHVTGYAGIADIPLAMEQGEIDGGCWSWESMRADYASELEEGLFVPIGQSGEEPQEGLEDVPLFRDLADTPEQSELIEAIIDSPSIYARPFAVPPGTPEDRLEILREAFTAAMADEDLLADAETAGREINPVEGSELEEVVNETAEIDESLLDEINTIVVPQ